MLHLGMQRLTYKIYNTKVVIIDDHKVICDDKIVKKLLEYILKNAPAYAPHLGLHPYLGEIFGKNIKLIDEPNDKNKPQVIY